MVWVLRAVCECARARPLCVSETETERRAHGPQVNQAQDRVWRSLCVRDLFITDPDTIARAPHTCLPTPPVQGLRVESTLNSARSCGQRKTRYPPVPVPLLRLFDRAVAHFNDYTCGFLPSSLQWRHAAASKGRVRLATGYGGLSFCYGAARNGSDRAPYLYNNWWRSFDRVLPPLPTTCVVVVRGSFGR